MAVTYQIKGEVVLLLAIGTVEINDFIDTLHLAMKDSHFYEGSAILADEKNAIFKTTEVEANEAVFFLKTFRNHFRNQVAVIGRSSTNYEAAKLVERTCQSAGVNLRAFNNKEDAKEWIEQSAV